MLLKLVNNQEKFKIIQNKKKTFKMLRLYLRDSIYLVKIVFGQFITIDMKEKQTN